MQGSATMFSDFVSVVYAYIEFGIDRGKMKKWEQENSLKKEKMKNEKIEWKIVRFAFITLNGKSRRALLYHIWDYHGSFLCGN